MLVTQKDVEASIKILEDALNKSSNEGAFNVLTALRNISADAGSVIELDDMSQYLCTVLWCREDIESIVRKSITCEEEVEEITDEAISKIDFKNWQGNAISEGFNYFIEPTIKKLLKERRISVNA